MPIFTKTIASIVALLSIPVFGSAVIGASYFSAVLHHLTDVAHGTQTSTDVSVNAPNWASGAPLVTPIATTVASSSYTSAASGLASSTRFAFEIAAIDANGTTTLSNSLAYTTDASNTQSAPEVLNISWTPVQGATGYAIFISSTTPDNFGQFFYATTSSTFYFATTSTATGGTYTNTDTTAYSTLINPLAPSYINGGNGTATSTTIASTTALQVNGNFSAVSQGTTTACLAGNNGVVFYNLANNVLWLCKNGTWTAIK
jgi:hypothetical protein